MNRTMIQKIITQLEQQIETNEGQIDRLEEAENLSEAGEERVTRLTDETEQLQAALDALNEAMLAQ
jgi:predicted nuclease with TOPRIM domain